MPRKDTPTSDLERRLAEIKAENKKLTQENARLLKQIESFTTRVGACLRTRETKEARDAPPAESETL